MGKKGKVGKSRRDRFYHLAKETGYRSRAAFKLIQLNRKFEFLQKSNVIVDLCAAPGGWLQVAAANAPMSNHIIGIDLDPINPIKNVKTLQEDITTEKCRQALKKELLTVKADLFLNDGAPNVGKNWLHDAFQQAELTLAALKLATEFLRKGGWFVTKLFRSKDYDPLMWIFQQLFKNVHATKPQASRNESAEIFVVCQNYNAPDKIDPKFLNPKYAFSDIQEEKKLIAVDLMHPEKKRRQREGYPEGDYTLFHSLPATQFLASSNFMELLAQSSEVKLDSEEIENHPLTTTELKECLKDIKLLGKKDIRSIINWRKNLKKAFAESETENTEIENIDEQKQEEKPDKKTSLTGEDSEDEDLLEEEKEIEEMEKLLEEKQLLELKAMKKAKKKVQKSQSKQKTRIDLKMAIPGDQIDIEGDINMFNIKRIKNKMQLTELEKGDLSHLDAGDIYEESDDDTPKPKGFYFDRNEKKHLGAGEDSDDEEEEMEEEPTFDDSVSENDDEEEEEVDDESANPLLVDMGAKERMRKDKEETWFSKSVFADLEKEADEDIELVQLGMDSDDRKKALVSDLKKKQKNDDAGGKFSDDSSEDENSDNDSGVDNDEADDTDSNSPDVEEQKSEMDSDLAEDSDSDEDSEDSDTDYMAVRNTKKRKRDSSVPAAKERPDKKATKFDGIEVVPAVSDVDLKLNEEGLAIGAAMVQSRKRRREIIESGYHRYMYDDEGLPDWFVNDDKKHTQRQMPVTKGEIEEYKMKSKAIDAQPIKKIAEAKARKKKRVLKSLEKARKKANAITDNVDVSEKEKWNQIKHVYKKAGLLKKAKEKVTYVVSKKGAGKKVSRPAGVEGKFKVVDSRMKKDMLGQKRAEMKKQKKFKSGNKKNMASGKRRVRR